MSVWREDFVSPPRGYPIDINVRWNGLRSDLEAAVRYRRTSYFFKGLKYDQLTIIYAKCFCSG